MAAKGAPAVRSSTRHRIAGLTGERRVGKVSGAGRGGCRTRSLPPRRWASRPGGRSTRATGVPGGIRRHARRLGAGREVPPGTRRRADVGCAAAGAREPEGEDAEEGGDDAGRHDHGQDDHHRPGPVDRSRSAGRRAAVVGAGGRGPAGRVLACSVVWPGTTTAPARGGCGLAAGSGHGDGAGAGPEPGAPVWAPVRGRAGEGEGTVWVGRRPIDRPASGPRGGPAGMAHAPSSPNPRSSTSGESPVHRARPKVRPSGSSPGD